MRFSNLASYWTLCNGNQVSISIIYSNYSECIFSCKRLLESHQEQQVFKKKTGWENLRYFKNKEILFTISYKISCGKNRWIETRIEVFCSQEQVSMVHKFESGFVMQTDAKCNSNEFNMPLVILFRSTNTLTSFLVMYCFISFKSLDTFIFFLFLHSAKWYFFGTNTQDIRLSLTIFL